METNIELSSYQEKKQKIKSGLSRVTQGFVEIGHELKQIRDQELYKLDGYGSITEFARAEYGLEHWDTSRFIAINDKYASGPKLLEQYEGYKYGLLAEMLSMSEEELNLVSLRTTRAEIRDIKAAKREAETEGRAPAHVMESHENTQSEVDSEGIKKPIIPEGDKLLIEFFRDKSRKDILKELAAVFLAGTSNETMERAAEIINPSGHLMFRKGMIILMFEADHIKYSKFGGESQQFMYADLICDIYLTFDMSMPDPWVSFYGEPEPEPIPDPPKGQEKKENTKPSVKTPQKATEKPVSTQSEKKNIQKPKSEETVQAAEDNLPGQIDITEYKECIPEAEIKKQEISIDFTRSLDSLAKEFEAKGNCPPDQGSCRRNGEEGEAGKKICIGCWKDWLNLEKVREGKKNVSPENVDNSTEIVNDVEQSATDSPKSVTGYEEEVDESYNFSGIPRASDRLVTMLAKLFVEAEGKRLLFGRATLRTPEDDEITYMLKNFCTRETICIDNDVVVSAAVEIIEFSRGDEDLGICLYPKFANQVRKQLENYEESRAEIIEADIVHTPAAAHETMKLNFHEDSGEVEVLISRSKGVRLIRVIDTDTGESWEVTIS